MMRSKQAEGGFSIHARAASSKRAADGTFRRRAAGAPFDVAAEIRAKLRRADFNRLDTVLPSAVPLGAIQLGDPNGRGQSPAGSGGI
jgi:hypothetical protein